MTTTKIWILYYLNAHRIQRFLKTYRIQNFALIPPQPANENQRSVLFHIWNHDLVTDFCFLGGWVCKIEIMEFLKYIVYQILKILRRYPQVLYYFSCAEILKSSIIFRSPGSKIWHQMFKNIGSKVCSVARKNISSSCTRNSIAACLVIPMNIMGVLCTFNSQQAPIHYLAFLLRMRHAYLII